MDIADFLGQGWKYPVSTKNKKILSSSGEQLIEESIALILGTHKGEWMVRPEFGSRLNELIFMPNTVTAATLAAFYTKEALEEWEPRIEVLDVTAASASDKPEIIEIKIEYRIMSLNSKHNLVYPFYLERAGG